MRSFTDPDRIFGGQPPRMGVSLARLDVGRGREALYRDQLPELLSALATETRVASIKASSAMEGVTVAPGRMNGLAEPGADRRFRNRNEREFAGYRDAIDEIMRATDLEAVGVPYILHLHRLLFRYTEGGGGRLKAEENLIVSYEQGERAILFTPPPPKEAEALLVGLCGAFAEASGNQIAHPVLLVGAFVLDFLAIHPVLDGNGRLARLLTSHLLLRAGYGVPRYASVEQRMFDTKESYYAALYASQRQLARGRALDLAVDRLPRHHPRRRLRRLRASGRVAPQPRRAVQAGSRPRVRAPPRAEGLSHARHPGGPPGHQRPDHSPGVAPDARGRTDRARGGDGRPRRRLGAARSC